MITLQILARDGQTWNTLNAYRADNASVDSSEVAADKLVAKAREDMARWQQSVYADRTLRVHEVKKLARSMGAAAVFGHSVLTKFTNNSTWYEVIDPFGRSTGKSFRSIEPAMAVARALNRDWAEESQLKGEASARNYGPEE